MDRQMIRTELGRGVFLSTITDAKFKSNRISVNLVLPLQKETVADTAIVPFLLRKRSRECPDFTRLNERLCELYGAILDADVHKYGGYQILNLCIQTLDDRYTIGAEPVMAQCARLISSLLLDPYLPQGVFDEQDFQLEKQSLIDTIESQINDKRDYAISRCNELLFEGEMFAIKKYGTKEQAQKITPASATAAYHNAVKKAVVEIMFIGCGDSADAASVFRESFAKIEREPFDYVQLPTKACAKQVTEQTDHMEVSQGKLVLGFRIGKVETQEAWSATKLMCALYGGTPFSRLFLNVREKYSLCYYCAARPDKATGTILVDSGVEACNKQKAVEEILNQLKIVQEGGFEDEELQNTILAVSNALKSVTDTLGGMEGWYLSALLSGTVESPLENAKKMEAVTRAQICEAAQRLTLDTIYFLTGKESIAE